MEFVPLPLDNTNSTVVVIDQTNNHILFLCWHRLVWTKPFGFIDCKIQIVPQIGSTWSVLPYGILSNEPSYPWPLRHRHCLLQPLPLAYRQVVYGWRRVVLKSNCAYGIFRRFFPSMMMIQLRQGHIIRRPWYNNRYPITIFVMYAYREHKEIFVQSTFLEHFITVLLLLFLVIIIIIKKQSYHYWWHFLVDPSFASITLSLNNGSCSRDI